MVRVLGRNALGSKKLTERGISLNLTRHEGVELARRAGVLRQLLLDNVLDLLPTMSDAVNHLGNLGGDDDDTVLISNDGITGADHGARNTDDAVALPGLHGGRALSGSGGVREAGEAVVDDLIGVADGAIRDEAANAALLQAEEFDIPTDRFVRADRGHDQDLVGTAQLKGLVLGAVAARGLVGSNVGPSRDKVQRDGAADALHAGREGTGIVDLGAGPSHDPKTVDEGLGGEGAEPLQELVGYFSAGGRAGGHGSPGGLADAGTGDGAHCRGGRAAKGGGEHDAVDTIGLRMSGSS